MTGGAQHTDRAAATMDYRFEGDGLVLAGHLAVPETPLSPLPGLVLCHGFPVRGRESHASGKSFPELAERIAETLGWLVLTINFRGSGNSEGNFSLSGWRDDIAAAVKHVRSLEAEAVWLAGFGTGGALCLAEGARNPRVRGVAAMAAPADFHDWAKNPRQLLLHSRRVGVIKDDKFPANSDEWGKELREINPIDAAARLAPRSLLSMHGDSDDLIPSLDARAIADSHGDAELLVIQGAGHELRHDPRAVAVFMGWLGREYSKLQEELIRAD